MNNDGVIQTTYTTIKVSVLMPLYNTKEEHLRGAIESILAQTFRDFEFLIINDASTDATVEQVVVSYNDPRIRYYANKENMGISAVRNKLIDLAQGKYLAIMDHDDISLPDRFKKEVEYLDAHHKVGVIGCQFEQFQDGSSKSCFPVENADIRVAMLTECVIMHPASMIRKSVLDETGLRYEAEYSPAEDYALYCKLLPYTEFHNIDEVLFRYRWHDDNTCKQQNTKMLTATNIIHERTRSKFPELYKELNNSAQKVTTIRLFGVIPLLKIISQDGTFRSLLFNNIPIIKTVSSATERRLYLFNTILVYRVKKETRYKKWTTG